MTVPAGYDPARIREITDEANALARSPLPPMWHLDRLARTLHGCVDNLAPYVELRCQQFLEGSAEWRECQAGIDHARQRQKVVEVGGLVAATDRVRVLGRAVEALLDQAEAYRRNAADGHR